MKFRITFKDPDGVYDSINDVAKAEAVKVIEASPLGSALDLDSVTDDLHQALKSHTRAFISDGEYLTVEVDTEAATCVVVKR